ncbi:MAG: aminotransferase class I/II-fold pyridoxal phosphate-dependent enzyme, partial [Deltaproteobacteria bacterium]|nr:aminotransferase class I/II-fold pyridoxal phosphate-dependent enzyme [Deltaproteobacteria bacterium]
FDTLKGATHIIPLMTGDAKKTMDAAKRLLRQGVFIQGIRPPSVPRGQSRLRITVSSEHAGKDLLRAIDAIRKAVNEAIA